ncbi:sensor histidine kinase [Larkinella insperata]|uniref:Sensor histidine kinase n=1 Tax=Larkinella insperata TaxID=332158 RepID=A0ABW3QJW9_9BACT|nr:histidine kinase [Larkinella insperata]
MSGEAVLFVYLGSVGAIFLLNAVQWSFFRDWVYGLFTLQTLIWFAHSAFNRLSGDNIPLSESQNMAVYAAEYGLVRLLYVGLIYRLFDLSHSSLPLTNWLRWVQRFLGIFLLAEVGIMLLHENWHLSPSGRIVSTVYWCLLMSTSLIGSWVAAQRRDAVGMLFLIGSVLLLVNETNNLFYYTGYPWTLNREPSAVQWHIRILGASRILQLLCFSLCLMFRQRQLAVSEAVEQTRREQQLIQQRLETQLAFQRLEQEKTQVQLRALQAQVNPHFLFNSLNSLSSLIDDNPEQASQFVDQLSQVYRYLLKANEQPLTTLARELDFIQSYSHLLKTRYERGLTVAVRVDPAYAAWQLPPMTLQLLVENAVKHNVILAAQPLQIDIQTDDQGHLVIQNNLQRKRTKVLSNGVGLSTILAQYQKLHHATPEVIEAPTTFTVRIPLIEPVPERV